MDDADEPLRVGAGEEGAALVARATDGVEEGEELGVGVKEVCVKEARALAADIALLEQLGFLALHAPRRRRLREHLAVDCEEDDRGEGRRLGLHGTAEGLRLPQREQHDVRVVVLLGLPLHQHLDVLEPPVARHVHVVDMVLGGEHKIGKVERPGALDHFEGVEPLDRVADELRVHGQHTVSDGERMGRYVGRGVGRGRTCELVIAPLLPTERSASFHSVSSLGELSCSTWSCCSCSCSFCFSSSCVRGEGIHAR